MLGLYLCARAHRINNYQIKYNDIEKYLGVDYLCDCRILLNDQALLSGFDYFIATPPCNYYSRMNWRRDNSEYSLKTKDLLPLCLLKLAQTGKPFLVENVLNKTLILDNDEIMKILEDYSIYWFYFGQHIFFSNIFMFTFDKSFAKRQNKQYITRSKRDNNYNVHIVIEEFLRIVVDNN